MGSHGNDLNILNHVINLCAVYFNKKMNNIVLCYKVIVIVSQQITNYLNKLNKNAFHFIFFKFLKSISYKIKVTQSIKSIWNNAINDMKVKHHDFVIYIFPSCFSSVMQHLKLF